MQHSAIRFSLAASVLAAAPVFANPSANLNAQLSKIQSMTADFSQSTTGGARSFDFSGTMSMQRPNRFFWKTQTPAEQWIVANGNTLWVYDKDLQQATRQSAASGMGDAPALLLSGDVDKIAQNFNVTQPDSGRHYYVLRPKSSQSSFRSLSLSFNGGKPVMMVLNDNLGQTTSIRFSNVRLNPSIPASRFAFAPPQGTDVIEQ